MRLLLSGWAIVFIWSTSFAVDPKSDLKVIDTWITTNQDTAIFLSEQLLVKSKESDDKFGIVKANLYLGYLLENKDAGKAVIHYLEGIRYADDVEYKNIDNDRIWLRRNIANIFRKFEANSLATKYNLEAIGIAKSINNQKQIIDIKFNQALVYINNENFDYAIDFFLEIIPLTEDNAYRARIINQLGIAYMENGEYSNARESFEKLATLPNELSLYTAKALHNLGEIEYISGQIQTSINHLYLAIEKMEQSDNIDHYGLFNIYRNIGLYLFESGKLDESEKYLKKAEGISAYAEWDVDSFIIYKTLSELYYTLNNSALGKKYSELYFDKIQKYIQTQEEIQKKDKEYNFDLITKRYFDEVEKQEHIASILFFSKLSSGTLMGLLLLVIAYYKYEKYKVRKSIMRELERMEFI